MIQRQSFRLGFAILAWWLLTASSVLDYVWHLPSWVPTPTVPADNPMSPEKVELGRHLFYDKRLSADNSMSCASCHHQDKAFTDGLAVAEGITGQKGARSAMSLANVAYLPVLTWANPNLTALEVQALVPILGSTLSRWAWLVVKKNSLHGCRPSRRTNGCLRERFHKKRSRATRRCIRSAR